MRKGIAHPKEPSQGGASPASATSALSALDGVGELILWNENPLRGWEGGQGPPPTHLEQQRMGTRRVCGDRTGCEATAAPIHEGQGVKGGYTSGNTFCP